MDRKAKGKRGEERAKTHYQGRGYEILEMNYRFRRAEIDLIVLLEEELLVFVEVKLRTSSNYGYAESFVSAEQQGRIREAAEDYILGIDWKKDVRFDIVTIGANDEVEVFEDAF